MNTQVKKKVIKEINARAIATEKPRLWNVEVLLGKNIVGIVQVSAKDKESAKSLVFVRLDFKVSKAY